MQAEEDSHPLPPGKCLSTALSAFRIKKPVSETCSNPNQINSQVKKYSGISLHTKQRPPPPSSPSAVSSPGINSEPCCRKGKGRSGPPAVLNEHRTATFQSYCFIKNRNRKAAQFRKLSELCGSRGAGVPVVAALTTSKVSPFPSLVLLRLTVK